MKVTHVLYMAAFICQIDPKRAASSTSVSWMLYETGDNRIGCGFFFWWVSVIDRQRFRGVGKTLSRGFTTDVLLNPAPRILVEDFRTQNLARSILIVISRCLCTRQKEELPVAGAASIPSFSSKSLSASPISPTKSLSRPSSYLTAVSVSFPAQR